MLKTDYTRRFCTKCKAVTSWKIDPAINHSRCLVCGSDSRHAKKVKRNTYEEPKMNKQYVQEQIRIAIKELRDEFGPKIDNIYQCPDCGAVAFKDSEHICFKAAPAIEQPKPRKDTLLSRVFDALPIGAPEDIDLFEADSPYNPNKIASDMVAEGRSNSPGSVKSCLSSLWQTGKINRRPAALRTNGKRDPAGGVAGFVYWRTA